MSGNPYLDLLTEEERRIRNSESATAAPGDNPYLDTLKADAALLQAKQSAVVRQGTQVNPAQAVAAKRLAEQRALPYDVVQRNLPQVQQIATAEKVANDTSGAPVLRDRFTDPAFAAAAGDDSGPLSLLESAVNSFKRGWLGLQQLVPAMKMADRSAALADMDAVDKQIAAGEKVDVGRLGVLGESYARMTPDQRSAFRASVQPHLKAVVSESVGDVASLQIDKQQYPSAASVREFTESKTFGDAVKVLRKHPMEILTSIGPESFVQSAPGMIAAVPAGLAAGPSGAALTIGANSYAVDYANTVMSVLQEGGVDLGNPQAVQQALRDPAMVEKMLYQATRHAAVVAPFDAVSAGAASKLLLPKAVATRLAARPVARQAANVAVQTPTQMALGAAGEAGGQVAAGQELQPGQILAEAVGELVGTPAEVASMSAGQVRGMIRKRAGDVEAVMQQGAEAVAAVHDAQQLQAAIKTADASQLKTRDPASLADFVERVQPDATLYIPAQNLAEVDLSATPAVASQMPEALASGGDVAISLADFLAYLPGEQLLPYVRTNAEAMSLEEANQFDPQAALASKTDTLLQSPEQAGMSPTAWADYQRHAEQAAAAAIEARDSRALRDLQWLDNAKSAAARELHAEAKALRTEIEAQVLAEIRADASGHPAQAVQHWLRTGVLPDGAQTVGAKLSTAALREMYGDGPAAPWRYLATNMVTSEEGLHPDVVAEMFGFSSGDQMVRDILSAEPVENIVNRLTEERLAEQRPDIADAVARERSAEALVADRARQRFLATEAAALAQAIGSKVLLAEQANQYAESSIAQRLLRDLRPAQFKASAARAGRAAAEAFRQGDTLKAAKWKQSEVLQHALQTEATQASSEIEKALKAFKRMGRPDESRDGNLANTARAILAQYGLGTAEKTPADFLDQVKRYDPDLHADLVALMEGMPAPRDDYRNLTVGEFREVRDRVEAVWSLARSTREIEIDGKKVQIEHAATELAKQLAAEKPAKREQMVGTNTKLDLRMRVAGVKAALRRVEFWADARDRGNKSGPFRAFIWQPVSEAVTRYRAQRNEYVNRFFKLLKTIEPTLKPGKIAAPELADGMVFADRSALLHALLHLGNESNRRKLLLGYQWATQNEDGTLDTSRWDRFLTRMHAEGRITKADWDFAQATWTLLEEMKPSAQRAHKSMFGSYFAEITAEPLETPFGTYAGGYVPAVTDPLVVTEARAHGAMDDLLASQNSPMFPAVARGFTKGRIENYTRPLALDLRLLPAHIDKVARFASLGPVLRDVARLVTRNKSFRSAMDAVDPSAVESMLVPWLKRTATQTLNKAPETQADRAVARIAGTLRNRTGLLMMAGNVVNTLQQFAGFSVAALRVKPRHLGAGLMEFMRSPVKAGETINDLSPWMKQRSDSSAHDIDSAIEEMLTNPGLLRQAEKLGTKYGYALQQFAQNFIDRVIWLGAYRQAEASGASDVQAVRDADSAVRMTQSSFAPEDASKVEHAGAFTRLFLQFYSYFNGQANLLATEGVNAKGSAARLALVYLLGFAIPAFTADLIAKGMRGQLLKEDEDGDELAKRLLEAFFMSQARYALGMVPVVGSAGNAALGQLTPERFDDRLGASPAYSAIESAIRAPRSIARAVSGEGNPRDAVRDGLTAVALLTGLPVGPLIRPLSHLVDDKADEVTARGLLTGTSGRR